MEMRYEDENIWLTQKMMAALYDVSLPTINEHIKKIYDDSELIEEATIRKFRIVQTEGSRRFEVLQEQRFTKKDWALYKSKIADWQESYMNRLNKEYIELLSKDANPSDKFWRLDKRIKEDRKKTGVQLEMSRSNLIYNIISLMNEGAISYEDLEEFSDELKETVSAFVER